MNHQQQAPAKEIGAQEIGGALATVVVLTISWIVGQKPPAGLEGALAVLTGAAIMAVRRYLQDRKDATDT